jgi:hypothetical protein
VPQTNILNTIPLSHSQIRAGLSLIQIRIGYCYGLNVFPIVHVLETLMHNIGLGPLRMHRCPYCGSGFIILGVGPLESSVFLSFSFPLSPPLSLSLFHVFYCLMM